MVRRIVGVLVGLLLSGHLMPVLSASPAEVTLLTARGNPVRYFPDGRPDGGAGRKPEARLHSDDALFAWHTKALLTAPGTYAYNCYGFALRAFFEARGHRMGWLNRADAETILRDEYVALPAGTVLQPGDIIDLPRGDHMAVVVDRDRVASKWSEQGVFVGTLEQQPAPFLVGGERRCHRRRVPRQPGREEF